MVSQGGMEGRKKMSDGFPVKPSSPVVSRSNTLPRRALAKGLLGFMSLVGGWNISVICSRTITFFLPPCLPET